MKRLEEGFDPARLVGLEVETVLFAPNLAGFQFSSGVLLTALSEVAHLAPGEALTRCEAPPWGVTRLPEVIGLRVESASVEATGRLVVGFADGRTLAFAADDSGYESFIISMDGQEWFA